MTVSTRYCSITDTYLAELFFAANMGRVGISMCDHVAEVGSQLCAGHSKEVFGFLYEAPRVRKSRSLGVLWVVESLGSCRGQGFRTHRRALDEADYRARVMRWRAAQRRAGGHSCDVCNAEDVAGRKSREQVARACPHNLASMWLKGHTEPTPPEE